MIIFINSLLEWSYPLNQVADEIDTSIMTHLESFLANDETDYFILRNKTAEEIYNYSETINSEVENIIKTIFTANNKFFEYIEAATVDGSVAICTTKSPVSLERNEYYNNFNVSENNTMFSMSVTQNCTSISDRQLKEHFEEIQNEFPDLHRKFIFEYFDNIKNNILTYPYYYDNYEPITKDINESIILFNDYFTQYSMFFFFPCNDTTFLNEKIPYKYAPYINEHEESSANKTIQPEYNNVFEHLASSLADNTELSATCYSNKYKKFKMFGSELKSFTKVNEELLEFITENINVTSKTIRSDEFFQFIYEIVKQRLENAEKRIYVGQDPILFTNINEEYNYISINKPCYIVVTNMQFSDYMKNVEYNFRRFNSMFNENVLKKTATYIMVIKNNDGKRRNTIYDYLRQFNFDNVIYTEAKNLFINNNFTISDSLIVKHSSNQMNQKVISICNKKSKNDIVYGVMCTHVPIDEILYKTFRDQMTHEILMVDQLTFNFIYQSDSNINNYMYFLTNTIKDQNEVELEPELIAQHPDGTKYQFLQCYKTIELIDITNDNAEVTFDFSRLNEIKTKFPTVDFEKINVCFTQLETPNCELYIHIHPSDIPFEKISAKDSIYQYGIPLKSYSTIEEFYSVITEAMERNMTGAVHAYLSLSQPELLTYYEYTTQILEAQPEIQPEVGRIYTSGIFSIYKFTGLSHSVLDEIQKFLVEQFGNYSSETGIFKEEDFETLITYDSSAGLSVYYYLYPHRKYIDFLIFPMSERKNYEEYNYVRFGPEFHKKAISPNKIELLIKANILQCKLYEDQFGIHEVLSFSKQVEDLVPGEQFGTNDTIIEKLRSTDGYVAVTPTPGNGTVYFNCSLLTHENNLSLIGMEDYTKYINLRYGIEITERRDSRWVFICAILMISVLAIIVLVITLQLIK